MCALCCRIKLRGVQREKQKDSKDEWMMIMATNMLEPADQSSHIDRLDRSAFPCLLLAKRR